MKKILLTLLLIFLSVSVIFAAPLRFIFADLGQHPEILMGFLPTYLLLGGGYELPSIIDGNKTEIQMLLGAGYNQRKMWQDQVTGEPIYDSPLIYDIIQTDWIFKFSQGFWDSPVKGKDLLTLTLSYDGKFEVAKDSMVLGKVRENNSKSPVIGLDDWLHDNSSVYPDLSGNHQFLGTCFGFNAKLDMMEDLKSTNDGFVAKVDVKYAPLVLNKALNGFADYYTTSLNMVGSKTLFSLKENSKVLFSIVMIDRVNVGWMDGSAVPAYASGPFSLGRKVRGFKTWTYDTQFAAVNNFDIRLAGVDLGVKGIFPRINFFYDVGYGFGNYLNSKIDSGDGNLLMSTGVQVTVSFFDFIDLGYQIAYLFDGKNFSTPNNRVVGSFTFFLDF